MSTDSLVGFLDEKKGTETVQEVDPDQIDMKEIRQHGKFQDHKWDANNLVFETNLISDKEINIEKNEQKGSENSGKEEEESVSEQSDSFYSEITSESEEESHIQNEIADKAFEMQQKLNNHSFKDIGTTKALKKIEDIQLSKEKKKSSVMRQMSDFDKLLELIGTHPGGNRPTKELCTIP